MCAATLYVAWPLLWGDPLNLTETLGALSHHPNHVATLFRGEVVRWPDIPWDFIPTWMLITTPPVAPLLAALGIAYLARLCAVRPRDALANSPARFGLLALACLTLPVAAAIALNSNLYDDWRHMYFLYAPTCVLAAFGLRALADVPRPNLRAAAFALAALGIALAAVQTVRLHPDQYAYFNSLVDKSGLANRWEMGVSRREALEIILEMQPNGRVAAVNFVNGGVKNSELIRNARIIPKDDRRSYINLNFPSFIIVSGDQRRQGAVEYDMRSAIWKREIYGVPLVAILDARAESEAVHREIYMAARASQADASAGGFDIYADGGKLTYVKDDCGEESARGRFGLSIFPVDQSDMPEWERETGFDFHERGAIFDGRCVIVQNLPRYPISHIETRQLTEGEGELWSARILFDAYYQLYRDALASLSGEPAMRSDFDVYMKDGTLTYVKAPCGAADARGRFFLSAFPADPDDLPQAARDAGLEHEPLNFDFERDGAIFDGKCVIVRDLPDYRISHVETGQFTPVEGELWSAQIRFAGYLDRYRRALASLSGEPAMRSDFDVYMEDGRLIYVKTHCSEPDARGRFFLSVFPADPSDLSQDARDAGFAHEPLNFDFAQYGAIFDGKCVIIQDLPDYPISRIETGQWIPGEGELWSARASVGDYR